jgi:hypothetical protein
MAARRRPPISTAYGLTSAALTPTTGTAGLGAALGGTRWPPKVPAVPLSNPIPGARRGFHNTPTAVNGPKFTGATPLAGGQATPAAPGIAPVPAAKPAGESGGDEALDSIFAIDSAQLKFRDRNEIAGLAAQQTNDDTDYSESMRRIATQRGQALQNADENANARGLFYSGQLGKRRQQLEAQYKQTEGDAANSYQRAKSGRQGRVDEINRGEPLELEGLRQEALGRALTAKQNEPPPPLDPAADVRAHGVDLSKWTQTIFKNSKGRTVRRDGTGKVVPA